MVKVETYLKPVAADSSGKSVVFPSITQSVVEAQNVSFQDILTRLTPYAWLSVLGFLAFLALMAVKPTTVLLLPLAVLSILSYKMGARFSMFGAPPVVLGLGAALSWLYQRFAPERPWKGWAGDRGHPGPFPAPAPALASGLRPDGPHARAVQVPRQVA